MRTMLKSTLLGVGLAAGVAFAAGAQGWYYPEYSYGYYGYPYHSTYPYSGYGYYGYGYGYPWYYGSSPYYGYYRAYPGSLAYSDPYVYARPYSDSAGPAASGHTGY